MKSKTVVFILAIFCLITLTGCSPKIIKETRTEVVAPEDSMLVDVPSEPPPNMKDYVGLRYLDKEEILIDKYRIQTQNIEKANARFQSLREWKAKQLELYQDQKKE